MRLCGGWWCWTDAPSKRTLRIVIGPGRAQLECTRATDESRSRKVKLAIPDPGIFKLFGSRLPRKMNLLCLRVCVGGFLARFAAPPPLLLWLMRRRRRSFLRTQIEQGKRGGGDEEDGSPKGEGRGSRLNSRARWEEGGREGRSLSRKIHS